MNLSRIFRANLFLYTLSYLIGVSVAVFVVLALIYASLTYRFFGEMKALIGAETRMLNERYAAGGEAAVSEEIARRIQEPRLPRLFYLLAMEIKEGAYIPTPEADFASWAPAERSAGANAYRQWMQTAQP